MENATHKYHTHITSKHHWLELNLKEVWNYRDLIYLFTKRSFVLLYKQTILGPAWVFLNPLISSIVYAFVFGGIAGIGTEGIPSMLFYLCSNAIWIYEYKEDGLTKAGETLFYRNPRGYGLFFREKIQFLNYSFREKWDLRISFIINVGEMYPTKLVAEAIGLPVAVVSAMKAVRNLKHGIFRKDRG